MKHFILAFTFILLSVSAKAQTMASTKNQALNLTCVIDATPIFIELNKAHGKARLHINNYVDDNGRGHSRRFLSEFSLKSMKVTHPYGSEVLTFGGPRPESSEVRVVEVIVPRYMNNFGGMPNQPAKLMNLMGETSLGACYVQFLPIPPSL